MSERTVSIPDSLYQKAQQIAQQKALPVDEVIRLHLAGAFGEPMMEIPLDEQAELKAMSYLSDDTLWTIAREQMPRLIQERMSVLMTRNSKGTITESEYAELAELVERGDKLTLRKAQAMKYLTERGYKVTADDLQPTDA